MKKILMMLVAGAAVLMAGGNIAKIDKANEVKNAQVAAEAKADAVKEDAEAKRQKAIEAEYKKLETDDDLFDD